MLFRRARPAHPWGVSAHSCRAQIFLNRAEKNCLHRISEQESFYGTFKDLSNCSDAIEATRARIPKAIWRNLLILTFFDHPVDINKRVTIARLSICTCGKHIGAKGNILFLCVYHVFWSLSADMSSTPRARPARPTQNEHTPEGGVQDFRIRKNPEFPTGISYWSLSSFFSFSEIPTQSREIGEPTFWKFLASPTLRFFCF